MKRRIIFFTFVLFFSGAVLSFAQNLTKEQTIAKFVAGTEAYKKGNYEEAVKNDESIIESGWESGAAYFNLGNSYYRLGQTGKAMLNYERARRLIPRDGDLSFNMKVARDKSNAQDPFEEKNIFEKVLSKFIQFYSQAEMTGMLSLSLFLLAAFYLLGLYWRWPQSLRRGLLLTCAVIFIIFFVGLAGKIKEEKNLAVMMQNTEATFEPKAGSTMHYALKEGMKVKVLRIEGEWCKVERLDGKLGWVPLASLTII